MLENLSEIDNMSDNKITDEEYERTVEMLARMSIMAVISNDWNQDEIRQRLENISAAFDIYENAGDILGFNEFDELFLDEMGTGMTSFDN